MKSSELQTRREFSAGGVVFKRSNIKHQTSNILWLIGKHSGYHKWVLPKGLVEKGEHGWETALREVEEEMGVKAKLISERPIHRVAYVYWADFKQMKSLKLKVKNEIPNYKQSDEVTSRRRVARYQEDGGGKTRVFKVVSFYLMEYGSGDPDKHDWEMEEAEWLPYDEAVERLAFEGEREALMKANDRIIKWLMANG
ncbi:MAG: hypothetical protein A2900_00725 [Candidatus Chisholmbacteria bacterium RIFCSPLOWO2_01_FULL_50_28]|uniref:Nudix hydrolase domain-containing protein n=1 Tax=Candidatus Chisholmbacteria bacterium RIFCSPHIGHO2_01_FULL_52_32 TaxID=1797591 RepID=A0A1G1VRE6_9BACT|nr:MAG: hypothetical protein A2786_00215 [Candidatus Chisholmbacteria bacterium RIFCSPHIGHO2_01_FULL_52_32]OGY19618.1 MAG: hypothetical protein A2900_00725 [Candidatus Chisholmbacteria bacterium RIFCSPLOWO2_01_FULL_50_28]